MKYVKPITEVISFEHNEVLLNGSQTSVLISIIDFDDNQIEDGGSL